MTWVEKILRWVDPDQFAKREDDDMRVSGGLPGPEENGGDGGEGVAIKHALHAQPGWCGAEMWDISIDGATAAMKSSPVRECGCGEARTSQLACGLPTGSPEAKGEGQAAEGSVSLSTRKCQGEMTIAGDQEQEWEMIC